MRQHLVLCLHEVVNTLTGAGSRRSAHESCFATLGLSTIAPRVRLASTKRLVPLDTWLSWRGHSWRGVFKSTFDEAA